MNTPLKRSIFSTFISPFFNALHAFSFIFSVEDSPISSLVVYIGSGSGALIGVIVIVIVIMAVLKCRRKPKPEPDPEM